MAYSIDKDAVVAKIKKIRAKWFGINNDFADGQKGALTDVLSLIDTIEVKEADLEKECSKYFEENDLCVHDDYIKFARHFFELGLKSKGE